MTTDGRPASSGADARHRLPASRHSLLDILRALATSAPTYFTGRGTFARRGFTSALGSVDRADDFDVVEVTTREAPGHFGDAGLPVTR